MSELSAQQFHDAIKQMTIEELNTLYTGGIDVQKIITRIFPGEMHLRDQGDDGKFRKMSFCGPGTDLQRRLQNYAKVLDGEAPDAATPPINQLDTACMHHDVAYLRHKGKPGRHDADRKLVRAAQKVIDDKSSTLLQRNAARIVKTLMKGKLSFGLGAGCTIELEEDVWDEIKKMMG